MGRRLKTVLDAFRYFTSRIFPLKSPIQHPRNILSGLLSSYSMIPKKKKPGIWHILGHYLGLTKWTHHIRFHDRYQMQHFKRQTPRRWPWAAFVGCWVLSRVCFRNLETIPYSKRIHLVLFSKKLERKLGDYMFDIAKEVEYQGKILPATHPQNVRVTSISDNIKKAMKDKGDGLNWEVVVVDKQEDCNAFCFPGGKIVVYTGILKHLTSDAEIAAVIGHEFGHGVARHGAETITSLVWLRILGFILKRFVMSFIANAMLKIFLKLPLSRRMEKEADYIGMMLMASAGYDPRVAPKLYEKLEKLMGDQFSIGEFLSTHPSEKKRAKLLSQPKVMAKALRLYSAKMREQKLSQSNNNNNNNTTSNSLAMIDLLQNLFLTVLVNHQSPWQ